VAITGFERAADAPTRTELDASQRAVVDVSDAASVAVLGAPGTGKTTTVVELVAERVLERGWGADELVVLSSSRTAATKLRDRLAVRVNQATNGPLARTVNSLAFEIVSHAARLADRPTPRLITGGEQDADIAGLLAGHEELGTGPHWPEQLGPDVRRLRTFRTEMRELMGRATEYDISPDRLRSFGRPEWSAAADFIDEYLQTVSAYREQQLDSSEIARYAIAAIERGEIGERLSHLRLVVVDDLQEATESTLALLQALAARGVAVIAFGDPDVAGNAFRGGEPDALGRLASVLGVADLPTLVLTTAHRQGSALRAFTTAVTERIGTAAAGRQRAARAVRDDPATPIATIEAQSPAREWAAIARQLREAHLFDHVAWSDMAVVVRSSAQIAGIRRALALAEVPARSTVGGTALRDDRAARALLTLVDVGSGRSPLTAEVATELLLGPFGGLDRLALRRLRLALRSEELAGGNSRQSDDLLLEALAAPGRFATIDHRVGRLADRLATTLAKLRASDGTIEELLWLAWERSGLATTWYEQALGSGITSAEANENLDGVLALFTAARRFAERFPERPASDFLAEVLEAEVPEDTLAPQPTDEAVLITTPAGTVGLEVEIVVVAGLQDGVWPNLRLRGSLLAPQELVRAATGIDSTDLDERRLVRDDELRMFALAVSRARSRVILAAVANEDEAPSVLFSLAPAQATRSIDLTGLSPLSLRGITGRLRRETVSGRDRRAAASALSRLAAEGVPGADPADWHGLLPVSTEAPVYDLAGGETVPISPSRLERFEESPLDWFIETVSGSQATTAMGMGTILHWAMETAESADVEAVWSAVETRWNELLFESPWMAEGQKRAARVLVAAIAEYLGDFARDGKTLVGAESRFRLEIDGAQVNGSIDRVERAADGSVVIVDLKTGSPITSQSKIDEHAQLQAYQLAYAEGVLNEYLDELGAHSAGGAKLLYVKKGLRTKLYREGVQQVLDPEQLEAFRTRIRIAAAGMAAAAFEGALELTGYQAGGASGLTIHRVPEVTSD
jgi:superfamily I DNA/RNA helicase/RecB family exonuclease